MLVFYLSMLDTVSDKDTFSELYRQYESAMYNIAYRILHDRFLAEDAVHNAFLRLMRYIPNIRDVTCHKTKALIVIIVKNAAIDLSRKRSHQNEVPDDSLWLTQDPDELVLDKIIADESFHELKCKLQALDQDVLDLLLLHYQYGYSGDEIAQILGISSDAVRQRMRRARGAVKKCLK